MGSKKALELMCAALADEDSNVRAIAVKALEKVVPKGDSVALEEIGKNLSNWFSEVRLSTLKLLITLKDKDTAMLITKMIQARHPEETNTDVLNEMQKALSSL